MSTQARRKRGKAALAHQLPYPRRLNAQPRRHLLGGQECLAWQVLFGFRHGSRLLSSAASTHHDLLFHFRAYVSMSNLRFSPPAFM